MKVMVLIKDASKDKLRGGFYTPKEIADFMLNWAINGNKSMDILEPSCGDGIFLQITKEKQIPYHSFTAVEFDEYEYGKAKLIGLENSNLINDDFHNYCLNTDDRFDLVIGNPPYIRYQYFSKEQQQLAERIFKKSKLKYSKLTNAWVSFVVGSSQLLKEKGKIAFVLPAEVLQVSYAQQLREFLAHFYNKINIVSFEKLVFPEIQQEVVLLLCEKDGTTSHKIEHLELRNADDLKDLDISKLKNPQKKIDFKSNKWTFYFLDQDEIDFLEGLQENKTVPKLGKFADVEVGITTGSNPFFTVPLSTVQFYGLEKYAKPLVGRSVQVPSLIFTEEDWKKNRDSQARTHLLSFPKMKDLNGSVGARDYLEFGVEQGINKGYKCGIRDEWQIIPSQKLSDALFIRRNHLYPKLIINEADAYTTDTMHRVNIKKDVNLDALVASYYNSLSLAFAEISGRSHGGGVLELMPSEVENIMLPYHDSNKNLVETIDKMIRANESIDKILETTNKKILIENYGFTEKEVQIADRIWKKLSNRRLNRN